MKSPSKGSPAITSVVLMLVGLFLSASAIYDVLNPEEETVFSDGRITETSSFMLILGPVLLIAGALGIWKNYQNNNNMRRRY